MIFRKPLILLFILVAFLSCNDDETAATATTTTTTSTSSSNALEAGDIIVTNNVSDVVIALDSEGNFKRVLFNVINNSETVYGLGWASTTNEVLITVDGIDRIIAVSAATGDQRTLITDANLNGALTGITQLASGNLLIAESNNVEQYLMSGFRVTTGSWPKALQSGAQQIYAKADGGFVHCSTTTDVLRTYDSDGNQENTTASGIGATTNAYGCMELANGNVAVTWNGTTDTVAVYDSALSGTTMTYNDAFYLGNPTGIAERSSGNLLIADATLHHLVEISSTGAFVNVIGDTVLNGPRQVLVIPSY